MTETGAASPSVNTLERVSGLREAADEAARLARQSYVTFLLLTIYALIIISSTTHEQLLRDGGQVVPLLNITLPLSMVYLMGPVLYVLFHSNLLLQLTLHARKLREFDDAVKQFPAADDRAYQRNLLYPFIFNEVTAPSGLGTGVRLLIRASLIFSVVILPPLVLCFGQVTYLPFHHWWLRDAIGLTELHQLLVLIDLGLICFFWRKITLAPDLRTTRWRRRTRVVVLPAIGALAIVLLTLVVGARPYTWIDDRTQSMLSESAAARLARLLPKAMDLPERDLVEKGPSLEQAAKWDETNDPFELERLKNTIGLDLRGRDLRGANLQGAVLNKARLIGADLRGANLRGAKLLGIVFYDPDYDISASVMFDGADLGSAQLRGSDLRYARFVGARLTSADLTRSNLNNADFSGANLQAAKLVMTWAFQSIFSGADLGSADLRYIQPSSIKLDYANLSYAHLDDEEDSKLPYDTLFRIKLPGVSFQGDEKGAFDNRNSEICRLFPGKQPTGLIAGGKPCDWPVSADAGAVAAIGEFLARDIVCLNRFGAEEILREMTAPNLFDNEGRMRRSVGTWNTVRSRFQRAPRGDIMWKSVAQTMMNSDCPVLRRISAHLVRKFRDTAAKVNK